jgi:hypothetical protein
MIKSLRKVLEKIAPTAAVVLMIVGFSAYHARRNCDGNIGEEFDPPPRYNTQFVLYPGHHIEGKTDLGFKPGWVVTYATPTLTYGTAFYVSIFGKVLARGTPCIITQQHMKAQEGIEKFQRRFAQLDAAVQVGTTVNNALEVLGEPMLITTNADGSTTTHFQYSPRELGRISINWLTNGFILVASNGIVVRKSYSYMSSH